MMSNSNCNTTFTGFGELIYASGWATNPSEYYRGFQPWLPVIEKEMPKFVFKQHSAKGQISIRTYYSRVIGNNTGWKAHDSYIFLEDLSNDHPFVMRGDIVAHLCAKDTEHKYYISIRKNQLIVLEYLLGKPIPVHNQPLSLYAIGPSVWYHRVKYCQQDFDQLDERSFIALLQNLKTCLTLVP